MNPGGALYLLPILICGYLSGMLFWPTRFFLIRLDGQRLFLACAGIGIFWVSALFIAAHFAKVQGAPWIDPVAKFIHEAMDFPHAAKLVICVGLSAVVPVLLNFIFWFVTGVFGAFWNRIDKASELINRIAVRRYGGPLARMLTRAADEQIPVMVVLDSRKVYCGYVLEIGPDVDSDGYIGILPVKSFTREKDSLIFSNELAYHAVEVSLVESAVAAEEKSLRRRLWASGIYFRFLKDCPRFAALLRRCGVDLATAKEIRKKLRPIFSSLRHRRRTLERIGLEKKIVRRDWTKLIPVGSIETVSFYEESAAKKWFASQSPASAIKNQEAANEGDRHKANE